MKKILLLSVIALILFLFCVPVHAVVYYVKSDVAGGDGSSWGSAFSDLQDALEEVSSGDEIWVAAGTYYPSEEYTAGNIRSRHFKMITGVSIYGGFAGSESSLDDRDVVANETILSGDIGVKGDNSDNCYNVFLHTGVPIVDETAILEGFTVKGGNANGTGAYNSYGGGMCNFSPSTPTIINCKFIGNTSSTLGGGMHNEYTSPTLTNCTFSGNTANAGGGMYNYFSSPILTDCTFSGNTANEGGGVNNNTKCYPILINCIFNSNTATLDGGGMLNSSASSATMTNCTFSLNTAEYDGGGMVEGGSSYSILTDCTFDGNTAKYGGGMQFVGGSETSLTNCVFTGNTAELGGGIYDDSSLASFTGCTFSDNSASDDGGGVYSIASWPSLTNSTFSDNSAEYGGGMYNKGSWPSLTNCTFNGNTANFGGGMHNSGSPSSPSLTNCTFIGNTASSSGGGIANSSSAFATLRNCTLSGNIAGDLGGGIYSFYADTLIIWNCIIWGNEAFSASTEEVFSSNGILSVTYSNVYGYGGSDENIDSDPIFVQDPNPGVDNVWGTEDDNYGDLHLQPSSPCIDSGRNAAVIGVTEDIDGDNRVVDGDGDGVATVDMGADEYLSDSNATVNGTLTLPAEAIGKEYIVIVDNDTEGDNGWINATVGTCGSGTTVEYSITDVLAGTYYIYSVVRIVSTHDSPAEYGDYIGFYGTGINPPTNANAVIPSSGSVILDITLSLWSDGVDDDDIGDGGGGGGGGGCFVSILN
ncbi:right-handed parallel beta-helix repeat-containing protein [Thermodesulfobacteriota bacterium]